MQGRAVGALPAPTGAGASTLLPPQWVSLDAETAAFHRKLEGGPGASGLWPGVTRGERRRLWWRLCGGGAGAGRGHLRAVRLEAGGRPSGASSVWPGVTGGGRRRRAVAW